MDAQEAFQYAACARGGSGFAVTARFATALLGFIALSEATTPQPTPVSAPGGVRTA